MCEFEDFQDAIIDELNSFAAEVSGFDENEVCHFEYFGNFWSIKTVQLSGDPYDPGAADEYRVNFLDGPEGKVIQSSEWSCNEDEISRLMDDIVG